MFPAREEDGAANSTTTTETASIYTAPKTLDSHRVATIARAPFSDRLLPNVSIFVGNPVAEANRSNVGVFDCAAYYGPAAWSWQSGLMSLGADARAARSCAGAASTTLLLRGLQTPARCANATLVNALRTSTSRRPSRATPMSSSRCGGTRSPQAGQVRRHSALSDAVEL
ncbi:hypothetical protein K437DRAFT_273984 [Tilletiaria anomala UBC 951]|uniref:Uncharacterized protein n=1 Tax=Tilletiaria anomala (strain ATCC 24038 / CBS 436.72 / UBC 951) TaxID=1037660 RepID=A0A066W5G7_TILAU|nr:uncharacterized protein K437DRAFT_273984 [Tilletiaria anomala UBC 951]KDN46309.1 hypothetical protein K437DRAFT_273984 [Tilletiaria anomala UBC 951]